MTAELLRCCWEIRLPAAFINYVTFCSNHVYFLPTIHLFWLSVCANLARISVLSKLQMRQVQSIKKTQKNIHELQVQTKLLCCLWNYDTMCQIRKCASEAEQPGTQCSRSESSAADVLAVAWMFTCIWACVCVFDAAANNNWGCWTPAAVCWQQRHSSHGSNKDAGGNRRSSATRSEGNPTSVCVYGGGEVFVGWCVGGECMSSRCKMQRAKLCVGWK